MTSFCPGCSRTSSFACRLRRPAIAIPANGVVREGDGTMTAWVTTDRRHFSNESSRRACEETGGCRSLAGLQRGELVVSDGAIFLSNMLEAPPTE